MDHCKVVAYGSTVKDTAWISNLITLPRISQAPQRPPKESKGKAQGVSGGTKGVSKISEGTLYLGVFCCVLFNAYGSIAGSLGFFLHEL